MRDTTSIALYLLATTACTPLPQQFECTSAAMCVDETQGFCEPSGVCSFADTSCMSGRRYGELSGSLASECVPGLPPRHELSFSTTADLTDVPIAIFLDASRVDYALADTDGAALRFVSSDDSLLATEIERWDPTGTSIVWVNVPRLSATSHIYMTYGAEPPPDPTFVWDANYSAVWHLGNAPLGGMTGAIRDSGRAAVHATASAVLAAPVPGKAGDALTFDGDLDVIAAPDAPGLQLGDSTSFTLEVWVKPSSFGPTAASNLFRYDDCDDGDNDMVCTAHSIYALRLEADGHPNVFYGPVSALSTAGNPTPFALGSWQHVALVRDAVAKTNTLYRNGQLLVNRPDTSTGTWITDGQYLTIGRFHTSGSTEAFHGDLDEARVSTTARSAAWIATQVAAMNDQLVVFD